MLTKWIICPCCNGNGRVENSAFSNGFTSTEWAEMAHDFDNQDETNAQQHYLRGDYDQACEDCEQSGKLRVPDVYSMTFAEKRVFAAVRRDKRLQFEYDCISAAERRMGA